MKRIDIYYGGQHYSVGNRDIEDLKAEIATGIASAQPYWLEVNSSEGEFRPAYLALTTGAEIALVPVVESDVWEDAQNDEAETITHHEIRTVNP